ncbi:bile acid:sodium symporter family protein [Thiomicrorhabdus sp. ZW0627]|uniref:bile acid:sodium symporter family protein n=1 Tax=Thiomicrorhabdus sp. ZW0627 TaxID=3039774 RepID=UPI0024366B9D|nr:bile acid:sodium symporter family protein [Thiomicrorhabdus sp. ZW0627]MDG6773180.1 bile acid:sodium symporter family protein [Thiomicrorhabdus sp. ZW0627]
MQRLTVLFPLWALLLSVAAFYQPQAFVELKSWIVPLLMVVMLGMGFTLRWHDFQGVWKLRKVVGLGVAVQFLVMPLAALLISRLFGLSQELTVGMMLVGATAGGTASNVMTYLAGGHVALSVSMTMVSTLVAVVMLPLLTWFYIGQSVDVPVGSMMQSLFKLIVVPLTLGMLFNHWLGERGRFLHQMFPLLSMSAIILIIAIVVGLNQSNLIGAAIGVFAAIILHNLIGLTSGYWISRKFGYDSKVARTVAIEVGMQNSGLSVALALKYFSAASALPGALFSIWHNLSGALFASFWQRKTPSKD